MAQFHPNRILCPTDMSELSRIAVRCGLAWAARFKAKAFVLPARELALPPRYFTPEQVAALAKQAEAAEEQVRADLEGWVGEIGVGDAAVEAVVGPGPADRTILRAIDVIRPDLVVMGTHGRTGYSRFLCAADFPSHSAPAWSHSSPGKSLNPLPGSRIEPEEANNRGQDRSCPTSNGSGQPFRAEPGKAEAAPPPPLDSAEGCRHGAGGPDTVEREVPMSVHDITVGMLLALPWALVAVVLVGSATETVRRWLEGCRWCGP